MGPVRVYGSTWWSRIIKFAQDAFFSPENGKLDLQMVFSLFYGATWFLMTLKTMVPKLQKFLKIVQKRLIPVQNTKISW